MTETSETVDITFGAKNPNHLNAVRNGTKENHVVAARETAAGTEPAGLPPFAHFRILGEQFTGRFNLLDPAVRRIRPVSGDVFGVLVEVLRSQSRVVRL